MSKIRLSGISKQFPRASGNGVLEVFQTLDLEVSSGQVVGLIGPSGCGKTTLLNIIALLEPPDQGQILVDGQPRDITQAGSLSMGYLFQRDALLPWRTAWKNALLGVHCQEDTTNGTLEEAAGYFRRFGLEGFEEAMPHTLSGGQRQRVALIQNLLISPDILLLDEPFGNLDYQTKLTLEEELLGVIRPTTESGESRPSKTVIFVTHDIEEAIVLSDRVIVLGQPPAGIVADIEVPLPRDGEARSPVSARQSRETQRLFGEIWGLLRDGNGDSTAASVAGGPARAG